MSYRLACELNEINSVGSVTGSMSGYYQCNPPKKLVRFIFMVQQMV